MSDRIAIRVVLGMIGLLALGQFCAGCRAPSPDAVAVEARRPALYPAAIAPPAPVAVPMVLPRVSLAGPNTCDSLMLVRRPGGGEPRLTKRRPAWIRSEASRRAHQAEIRDLIAVVVDEMGGDPIAAEFLYRKAIIESTGNEGVLHLLSPDVDAGRSSARYGKSLSSARWRDARVPVFAEVHGRTVQVGTRDAWSLGRGLYGMNTGYFLAKWSNDAPPWALCDPVVATVTAIWAIRDGLERCEATSLRAAYRWISAATCSERSAEKERVYERLARGRVRGLRRERFPANARADFGDRWPRATTDPAQLLGVIRWRLENGDE